MLLFSLGIVGDERQLRSSVSTEGLMDLLNEGADANYVVENLIPKVQDALGRSNGLLTVIPKETFFTGQCHLTFDNCHILYVSINVQTILCNHVRPKKRYVCHLV